MLVEITIHTWRGKEGRGKKERGGNGGEGGTGRKRRKEREMGWAGEKGRGRKRDRGRNLKDLYFDHVSVVVLLRMGVHVCYVHA